MFYNMVLNLEINKNKTKIKILKRENSALKDLTKKKNCLLLINGI